MKTIHRIVGSVLVCLLAACGDSTPPAPAVSTGDILAKDTPAPAAQVRVALIMKTLTNPFFIEMEKGARRAQTENNIDLRVRTATQETSIEQQIQLVEQEIEAKTQAIVIAPGDSMRLVPVLKKAQDAGIHIVNIDNRLSPEAMAASGMKPVPFISVDNEQGAYDVAKFMAARSAHRPRPWCWRAFARQTMPSNASKGRCGHSKRTAKSGWWPASRPTGKLTKPTNWPKPCSKTTPTSRWCSVPTT